MLAHAHTGKLVALLAEGVDRNSTKVLWSCSPLPGVALLAEGVDRHGELFTLGVDTGKSPSSRRAWIEIGQDQGIPAAAAVALLAEGVDRNTQQVDPVTPGLVSPSSRRAWIEIVQRS